MERSGCKWRKDVREGDGEYKEMESTKRGGEEQEQESTKEEKVEEVHTIQGDTNDATSSQNPANNECMITPTSIKLQRWHVKMAFPKGR
jgi:hypothetical protein